MLKDVVVSLLSQLDVLSGAIIALNFGFLMFPSSIGYLTGVVGSLITGSVTPVSFMYESMVLSYSLSKKFRERITMILIAAAVTAIFGIFGLPQLIVDRVGKDIFLAMLAGVGVYLAKVGLDISMEDKKIGMPCFLVAILTQLITKDLIWTVSISIPFGFVLQWFLIKYKIYNKPTQKIRIPKYKSWLEMVRRETRLIKPVFNRKVLLGSLALSTLTVGGNVAYVGATLEMTKSAPTYNQATIISGIADYTSGLIGGANMELIISPTASAPHPLGAAIIYMSIAAIILGSGLIYKIAKYIPISAMGGYLFVIGAFLILPYNAIDAFKIGDPVVVALTLSMTALTNPFYGLLAGLVSKFILVTF
jgi:adenine/guanine/hypoxanthine permease